MTKQEINVRVGPGGPNHTSQSIRYAVEAAQESNSVPLPAFTRVSVGLSELTMTWLKQMAKTHECSRAEIVRAAIAQQTVANIVGLYQDHTMTTADVESAVWAALGYVPPEGIL